MLWSLLGILLMGLSFPRCYFTERKKPRSAMHVQQPERPWTHNCKDDFTGDMNADKEWWIKCLGFVIIVLSFIILLTIMWSAVND